MIIKALAENTSSDAALGAEHGLSVYIETDHHKILFDTGASGLFAKNAATLGVDLGAVDIVVISHGHYDHGGGLKTFLEQNDKAVICMHEKAFGPYYARRPDNTVTYIGLDKTLWPNERFVLCSDRHVIDDELELFSAVKGEKLMPSGNENLLSLEGEEYSRDTFSHEQNLIIGSGEKTLLIAGCAHRGIVNIIDRFKALRGVMPTYVIGGFHLYSHGKQQSEAAETVREIGENLLASEAKFYTCHCTGIESYERLKAVMADKIAYLSTGDRIEIDI